MHLLPLFISLLLLLHLDADAFKNLIRLSVNCGSTDTSVVVNGKEWIGDTQTKGSRSLVQIKGSSTASILTRSSISSHQVPHNSARISHSQFSYAFPVSPGEKILRLHFNPAPYKGFKRLNDFFNVETGPFTLLNNFSASLTAAALGVTTFTKEFCISVNQNQILTIQFLPVTSHLRDSTYAFINGIEIIPVPLRLSYFRGGDHRPLVVGQKSLVYIDNSTALELIHRRNIEQDSVSLSDVEFSDRAKENETNSLTWKTPVDVGFRYLVRIHFSDLDVKAASLEILIDEMIVEANFSIRRYDEYGTLKYRDYVVAVKGRKEEGNRDLSISLHYHDEFADGDQVIKEFEIFKLSNPDNSLATPNAFLPSRDFPFPALIINKLLSVMGQGNATLVITILALINIIIHKLREICEESSTTEEEDRPSARAERFCRSFSLAEIQSATKNFSEELLIGKGGFGNVYMGFIDNGRETVAVKRLKSNSTQGKHEFLTEIETLSVLRHNNLVSLIGYYSDHKEMILVYEYVSNGTLADHLYKYAKEGHGLCSLNWKQRLNICIGSARGLDYIHTGHGMIHRDVKSSNILLDENHVAKVSDFGLARLEDGSELQSHISTKVKGTHGYLDPYYYTTRKLTRKSDTYAFGVVLLEVLCDRKPMDSRLEEDEYCLTRWAQHKINKGEANEIVALSLLEEIQPESLKIFLEVAGRCLHDEPKKRPTMAQIVVQLEFALALQGSGNTSPPIITGRTVEATEDVFADTSPPIITGQTVEATEDVSADTSPPVRHTNDNHYAARKDKFRESNWARPPFRVLEALWGALFTQPKKKEFILRSGINEAGIRVPEFEFRRLVAATDNFSHSHIIGIGGSSNVYKAVLSPGRTVALRMFHSSSDHNDEIMNEFVTVSCLHHRNIIKLLGYCIHGKRAILLYDFMENGTLDKFIFDEQRCSQLQWPVRFKVIIGIAKGLIYLHEETRPKIIHRDLKPSNISLDNEMNPKILDFKLARNIDDDHSEMTTCVVGTLGYLAPEYFHTQRISEKTDVFSFGVLVLVILSGMRPINPNREMIYLSRYAWELWNEGVRNVLDLVDKRLAEEYSEDEALRCIQVGLLCTHIEPQRRPTMASALKMLLGEEDLPLQRYKEDETSTSTAPAPYRIIE